MLTTSKITEENQIFSNMKLSSVKIGKVEHLSHAMKKDAKGYKHANLVMGGKSNNFTLSSIRLNLVKSKSALKVLSAPFIIALKIEGLLNLSTLQILIPWANYSLEKREISNVLSNQTWLSYFLKITWIISKSMKHSMVSDLSLMSLLNLENQSLTPLVKTRIMMNQKLKSKTMKKVNKRKMTQIRVLKMKWRSRWDQITRRSKGNKLIHRGRVRISQKTRYTLLDSCFPRSKDTPLRMWLILFK
jgi:hypothetical protein